MAQEYATAAFLTARVTAAAALDVADVQRALDDSRSMISLAAYSTRADLAHAYYAAHLLTLRYPAAIGGGESGPVTSKRAGEIAVTFASVASAGDTADPSRTYWGRLFVEQQRIAGASFRVVG